jgi:hypothetical protein
MFVFSNLICMPLLMVNDGDLGHALYVHVIKDTKTSSDEEFILLPYFSNEHIYTPRMCNQLISMLTYNVETSSQ